MQRLHEQITTCLDALVIKTTPGCLFFYFFIFFLSSIAHRTAKRSVLKPFYLIPIHPCLPGCIFQPLLPVRSANSIVRPIPTFTPACKTTWGTNPRHSLSTSTQRSSTLTETSFAGSKTAAESQVPFPLACLHLTSPSPLVPPTDLGIDVTTLQVNCNLQQKAGINTFSYTFFPYKINLCYAYKPKLSALLPSSLSLQWLLCSARSAALTFFSLLFWRVWQVSVMWMWQIIQKLTSAEASDFKGCFYTRPGMVRLQCSLYELQRRGSKAKVNSVQNPNKYSQNVLANIHQV